MLWANFLFSNLAKFCENFGKIWTKPSSHSGFRAKRNGLNVHLDVSVVAIADLHRGEARLLADDGADEETRVVGVVGVQVAFGARVSIV